jgi:hypothetical protein
VDIRVRSKERDLGSRRAGVRRFNSCSTHLPVLKMLPGPFLIPGVILKKNGAAGVHLCI